MSATNQAFDEFVNQHSTAAEESRVDWESRLDEWKKHLYLLYEKVEAFLNAYIKSGKIILKRRRVLLDEEHIGSYEVHALDILLGHTRITLMPIGTVLATARGRVDMRGPKRMVRFLLVHELAQESFEEPETGGEVQEADGPAPGGYAPSEYSPGEPAPGEEYATDDEEGAPGYGLAEEQSAEADWVWIISTPPPGVSYMDLAEESFKSAMMRVVNG